MLRRGLPFFSGCPDLASLPALAQPRRQQHEDPPSPALSSKLLVHWCPPRPSLPCPSCYPSPFCDPKPFHPYIPIQSASCSHPRTYMTTH